MRWQHQQQQQDLAATGIRHLLLLTCRTLPLLLLPLAAICLQLQVSAVVVVVAQAVSSATAAARQPCLPLLRVLLHLLLARLMLAGTLLIRSGSGEVCLTLRQ
jgi:aspartate-semialdehyde dehydrogenase